MVLKFFAPPSEKFSYTTSLPKAYNGMTNIVTSGGNLLEGKIFMDWIIDCLHELDWKLSLFSI